MTRVIDEDKLVVKKMQHTQSTMQGKIDRQQYTSSHSRDEGGSEGGHVGAHARSKVLPSEVNHAISCTDSVKGWGLQPVGAL